VGWTEILSRWTVLFTHTEDVHGAFFPLFRAVTGSAI
jgi:hypothetical protein